jgi:hypothetical protein
MGIVNCADEQYGRVGKTTELRDPAVTRHLGRTWENSVYNVVQQVLRAAAERGVTPAVAANDLADAACTQPHPIFPNKPRDIIASLVSDGWAQSEAGNVIV